MAVGNRQDEGETTKGAAISGAQGSLLDVSDLQDSCSLPPVCSPVRSRQLSVCVRCGPILNGFDEAASFLRCVVVMGTWYGVCQDG